MMKRPNIKKTLVKRLKLPVLLTEYFKADYKLYYTAIQIEDYIVLSSSLECIPKMLWTLYIITLHTMKLPAKHIENSALKMW